MSHIQGVRHKETIQIPILAIHKLDNTYSTVHRHCIQSELFLLNRNAEWRRKVCCIGCKTSACSGTLSFNSYVQWRLTDWYNEQCNSSVVRRVQFRLLYFFFCPRLGFFSSKGNNIQRKSLGPHQSSYSLMLYFFWENWWRLLNAKLQTLATVYVCFPSFTYKLRVCTEYWTHSSEAKTLLGNLWRWSWTMDQEEVDHGFFSLYPFSMTKCI